MQALQLFWTFFKIGAFTLGGGYAMIPLVQREVVDHRGWMGEEEFLDLIALAQSAPGVIAVNTAVFVGYKIAGKPRTSYIDGPWNQEDPEKWLSVIQFPIE